MLIYKCFYFLKSKFLIYFDNALVYCYALGEDTISSDIDIAVIGRKDKMLHLESYEKALNRKINVNFYNSWKDIHKHLKDNILGGILLHGSIEI